MHHRFIHLCGMNKPIKPSPTSTCSPLFRVITTRKKQLPPRKEGEIDPKLWELLLSARKKDYEKICFQYGVTDFRWMLKRLKQMEKERQDEQAKVRCSTEWQHYAFVCWCQSGFMQAKLHFEISIHGINLYGLKFLMKKNKNMRPNRQNLPMNCWANLKLKTSWGPSE